MYSSIDDLPVFIFNKINKTGDLNLLKKGSLKKVNQKQLEQTWAKIYNEFIKEFGISDKFKEWIEKQKQVINHYCQAYVHGQKHELNFARIKEEEARLLLAEEEMSFEEVFSSVSKFMGFRLPFKETTVREFYGYLKLMEKSGRINPDIGKT